MNKPKYTIPNNARRGHCQNCGFVGLLIFRQMMNADLAMNADAELTKDGYVCLTCYETPQGTKSENQLHKRLPAEEYMKQ